MPRLLAPLAACAVALGPVAACSSDADTPKAVHVEAHAEVSATATAVPDLGPPQQSAIEGLPVPRVATKTSGVKTCTTSDCTEEYWSVPATSSDTLLAWYATQLEETKPWRDWQPCADPAMNEPLPALYQWSKPGISLELQIAEPKASMLIHIRSEPTDLPCN